MIEQYKIGAYLYKVDRENKKIICRIDDGFEEYWEELHSPYDNFIKTIQDAQLQPIAMAKAYECIDTSK